MDEASQHAIQLLETMAECSKRLLLFASVFDSFSNVSHKYRNFECVNWGGLFSSIEAYEGVKLHDGRHRVWHFNVYWDEGEWEVHCRIAESFGENGKEIHSFLERKTNTLDGLMTAMIAAIDELIDFEMALDSSSW